IFGAIQMNSRAILLAGAAAGVFVASPAAAAEGDTTAPISTATEAGASDGSLPENAIIITARRRNEQAQEVPLAISVLDQRAINDTGSFSVYKLQQLTPTLQVY